VRSQPISVAWVSAFNPWAANAPAITDTAPLSAAKAMKPPRAAVGRCDPKWFKMGAPLFSLCVVGYGA
jgi:hypothetical protein